MAKKVTKKTSKVNTTRKLTGDAAKQREKSDKETIKRIKTLGTQVVKSSLTVADFDYRVHRAKSV